jgi:glyoxylase-like metal-dependent hydrolase (beta-lactamase superfamily II)
MKVTELLDGVWLHTSERAMTTTTVLALGERECMVVDPAMQPSDLDEIAALVRQLGRTVTLGWSTHPHWDHVLWSSQLGAEVVRFATRRNAELCAAERDELEDYLEKECPGHETGLCGRLTSLEDGERRWPSWCRVVRHEAHAPGHGALWMEGKGLLIAGDMVSDIEIPTLDLGSSGPVDAYEEALNRYEEIANEVVIFVPGHGAPGDGAELRRRLAADRRYLADLVAGRPVPDDDRCAEAWLQAQHELQVAWCAGHYQDRQKGF